MWELIIEQSYWFDFFKCLIYLKYNFVDAVLELSFPQVGLLTLLY